MVHPCLLSGGLALLGGRAAAAGYYKPVYTLCLFYACIGGGYWNHGTTPKWGELFNSTMSTGQWRPGVFVRPGHTACLEWRVYT